MNREKRRAALNQFRNQLKALTVDVEQFYWNVEVIEANVAAVTATHKVTGASMTAHVYSEASPVLVITAEVK